MDYDTLFIRVREGLIELISRELNNRSSAKIQTSIWIRFTKDDDVVNLAFNSLMVSAQTEVTHRDSEKTAATHRHLEQKTTITHEEEKIAYYDMVPVSIN